MDEFKCLLFDFKISNKSIYHFRFIYRKDSFWDKLVFKKIQALLGGRIECMITGSAPLEGKVLNFLRCALGCPVTSPNRKFTKLRERERERERQTDRQTDRQTWITCYENYSFHFNCYITFYDPQFHLGV